MELILEIAAGLISGALGGMGMGGGGVLILYLTAILNMPQIKSQGINLAFFVPSALVAVVYYIYKGKVKIKPLIPIIIGGFIGAGLGIFLSGIIDSEWIARLFGIGLIIMGIREIFMKRS